MGKGKPRHDPNKPQNQYGGDGDCPDYDTLKGSEWCHNEGGNGFIVKWEQYREDGTLVCNGNRHNCQKLYRRWLASQNYEPLNETE